MVITRWSKITVYKWTFQHALKGVAYNHIGLEVEQKKIRLQVEENKKERG